MKKLLFIFLINLFLIPVQAAGYDVKTLRIGQQNFYFNGVKSTSIKGLSAALEEYKSNSIVVFLCTNGNSKSLMQVMAFLEQNGITNITLKSSTEKTNC